MGDILMLKKLLLVGFLAPFCALLGCGSASSSGGSNVVLAQSGYSNASLNGTYAFEIATSTSTTYLALGTAQFSGTGTVSGTLTPGSYSTCHYSALSGTYSLQTSGLGTATITSTTSTPSIQCPATWTVQLSVAAAQQGQSVLFIGSDASDEIIGNAIKQ